MHGTLKTMTRKRFNATPAARKRPVLKKPQALSRRVLLSALAAGAAAGVIGELPNAFPTFLPDFPRAVKEFTRVPLLLFPEAAARESEEAKAAERAAGADAAAEAVRAAQSTPRPDVKGMIGEAAKRPSEWLGGFGSGDLDAVREEAALYRDGEGELYGPAVNVVAGCRNAEDPECRAVQILDRGFPERPPIPDDILAGRDEVIYGIGSGSTGSVAPGIGSSGVCTDFVISTKPVYAEEVCRPGGWYDEATCRTGWQDGPAQILTRWQCRKTAAVAEALACRMPVDFTMSTSTVERCFFGAGALADILRAEEETTAAATAVFPAVCEAPQFADEIFTCDTTLIVTPGSTCRDGDSTSARATGSPSLAEDGCPGGTWLEMSHKCSVLESKDPATHIYSLTLEGYPTKKLWMNESVEMQTPGNSRCRAVVKVEAVSCTGADCIAPARAIVYHDGIEMGTITLRLPYKAYDRFAGMTSSWQDDCEVFDEAAPKGKRAIRRMTTEKPERAAPGEGEAP